MATLATGVSRNNDLVIAPKLEDRSAVRFRTSTPTHSPFPDAGEFSLEGHFSAIGTRLIEFGFGNRADTSTIYIERRREVVTAGQSA